MRYTPWHQLGCRRLDRLIVHRPIQQIGHGWRHDQPASKPRFASSIAHFSTNRELRSDPSFLSSDVDQGFSRPTRSQEAILERARVHGIDSLNRLDFEADFDPLRRRGPRLLDDAAARQDLDLWSVLLDYRQMKDGVDGVRSIVDAMIYGRVPVKLHEDAVSEHIWRTVLPAAIEDERLLYEICRVDSAFTRDRPFVFADVVGQLLAADRVRLAIAFGTQLLISRFRGRSDLLRLFQISSDLGTEDAIHNFCNLTKRLSRYHIYDAVVPTLQSAGRLQHAFILHRQLLAMGDYPGDFEKVEPFVQELATRNAPLEPFLRELESHQISYSHQARRLYYQQRAILGRGSGASIGRKFGPGPGSRPIKLSDDFVARTFATRSVSFDFVLSGLRFVGLFEIGPAAVREMALAAKDLSEIQRRFQQLEKMGVDLGSSHYVRVMSNLCRSGQKRLLKSVLQSDMHHEVYEDVQTQKQLLSEYYNNSDWPRVWCMLAILNGGKTDKKAEINSAQLIIQMSLTRGDWRRLLIGVDEHRTLNQHASRNFQLTLTRLALRRIWANASVPERENHEYLDRHKYLVGLIQQTQVAGNGANAWQWRSVLHAVGRSGDWKLFHRLILSVARSYHEGLQVVDKGSTDVSGKRDFIDKFLNKQMQVFVLEVGLTADAEDENPAILWLRGVKLLVTMKTKYEIGIDFESLYQAFKLRLMEIFRGVRPGDTRKRLVKIYLRQLQWAWLESDALTEDCDPSSSLLRQQSSSIPNDSILKLFQLRSRSIWQHRRLVDRSGIKNIDLGPAELDDFDELPVENQEVSAQRQYSRLNVDVHDRISENSGNEAVFYADLLHPSYQNKFRGHQ